MFLKCIRIISDGKPKWMCTLVYLKFHGTETDVKVTQSERTSSDDPCNCNFLNVSQNYYFSLCIEMAHDATEETSHTQSRQCEEEGPRTHHPVSHPSKEIQGCAYQKKALEDIWTVVKQSHSSSLSILSCFLNRFEERTGALFLSRTRPSSIKHSLIELRYE